MGRKTRHQEALEGNFAKFSIDWLREHFEELPLKVKIQVTTAFGLKYLPNKIEAKSEVEVTEAKQADVINALRNASNRIPELIEN